MASIKVFLIRVREMPKKRALNSIRGKMSVLKRERSRRDVELKKLRSVKNRLMRPHKKYDPFGL